MSVPNRPDRELVERIAREEAVAGGVSFDAILNSTAPPAVCARRRALRRIKRETGCSTYGLATIFGCDHGAAPADVLGRRRYRPVVKARQHAMSLLHERGYGLSEIGRAFGQADHTSARRAVIVHSAEQSPDLAAWNRLGSRRAA